jgi:predicted dehydrogenase
MRGTGLLRNILNSPEVDIPAICDIDQKNLDRALDIVQKARGYRPEGFSKSPTDYRRMLERNDFRAVLIATPQELHAQMSLDTMNAGKFVASEVPACTTLEECWQLVHTQRKTGSGYMLLENYRYGRAVMQVANMVQKGLFGELTYAECAYIHEIRGMRFNPDGSLTWRGENVAKYIGDLYPTHSVGPVCGWMGINRTDRLLSLVTMSSKAVATHEFAERKFGKDSAAARVQFLNGDTNNTLIRTAQGRLISVRYDVASPRPSGMGQYSLQGTRGSYSSAFGEHKAYVEGRSKPHTWEPLDAYRAEYEHPYWAQRGADASKTDHGGGDYFVLSDFVEAVRTGQSPIDVYDAATWSSIRPLSAESLRRGSAPVEIPDFKKA